MALSVLHRPREGQGLHGVHGARELRGGDDQGGWAAPRARPRLGRGPGSQRGAAWRNSDLAICRALTTAEALRPQTFACPQVTRTGAGQAALSPFYRGKHGSQVRGAPGLGAGAGASAPVSVHPGVCLCARPLVLVTVLSLVGRLVWFGLGFFCLK